VRCAAGAAAVLLLLCAHAAVRPAAARADTRPNVILIVTDEERPAGLAVMPKTVRLMMRFGRRYADAYVTTPLGNPSRVSLMTGRYAHNTGVIVDGLVGKLDQDATIQAALQAAGYRTALFGKYLDSWADPRCGCGMPQHWDRWAIFRSWIAYYDASWNVQGTVRRIHEYSTSYIGDRAVGFVQSQEGHDAQPWFMELATSAAQAPPVAAPPYVNAPVPPFRMNPARGETDRSDKPPYVQASPIDPARDAGMRRDQLRTYMSVDDMVARVFRALHTAHELRRTLIVFTSDNGYQWGEHGLTRKGTPYPYAYRVPLLVHWPGHFRRSGRTLHRMAANIDVAPTILEAAGTGLPNMDGRSLLHPWDRREMLLEFWRGGGGGAPPWVSVRTARWQYTEYYHRGAVSFREFYPTRDVYQLQNRLHDGNPANNPDVAALHARLDAVRSCAGTACP
jgi:arylsulfatase A-like enzyme